MSMENESNGNHEESLNEELAKAAEAVAAVEGVIKPEEPSVKEGTVVRILKEAGSILRHNKVQVAIIAASIAAVVYRKEIVNFLCDKNADAPSGQDPLF